MEGIGVIFSNYYINVAFLSWLIAQILKTLLTLFVTREFVPERLIGAGGMPSAHSALVVSLTIAIERKLGFSSAEFALSLVFAAVVMYDAMGVRRAAGEQAKVLNKMIDLMSWNMETFVTEKRKLFQKFLHHDEEGLDTLNPSGTDPTRKQSADEEGKALLKEFLGHTPIEVLAGAVLGAIIAFTVPIR